MIVERIMSKVRHWISNNLIISSGSKNRISRKERKKVVVGEKGLEVLHSSNNKLILGLFSVVV